MMADDPKKHSTPDANPVNPTSPGDEDPLVELARIVSEDGQYYKSQRQKEAQPPLAPAAPAHEKQSETAVEAAPPVDEHAGNTPVLAEPADAEDLYSSDLEQELMQELEQSISDGDPVAQSPAQGQAGQHVQSEPAAQEWSDESFEAAFAGQAFAAGEGDVQHQSVPQPSLSPDMAAEQDAFSAQVEEELNRQYMERQRIEHERLREEQERQEQELERQRQEQQRLEDEKIQREIELELARQQEEEQRQRELELQLQEEQRREDERLQREFEQQRLEEEQRLREAERLRIEEARIAREEREQADLAARAALAAEHAEPEFEPQSRSPYVNPPKLDQAIDDPDMAFHDQSSQMPFGGDLAAEHLPPTPAFSGHRVFSDSQAQPAQYHDADPQRHDPIDPSQEGHHRKPDSTALAGLPAAATLGAPGIPDLEDTRSAGTDLGDAGLGNLGGGVLSAEPSIQQGEPANPFAGGLHKHEDQAFHAEQPPTPPAELDLQSPAGWNPDLDPGEEFEDDVIQDDDEFEAMPQPTVTRDYDVIPEEHEPYSRSRKGLLAVAGVMAVVLIGGSVVAIMGTGGDDASQTDIPIIGASEGPLKETVAAGDDNSDQTAGEAVFETSSAAGKSEERLINRAEEPRDVSRIDLPNSAAGTSVGGTIVGDNGIQGRISADTAGQPTAPQIDPIGARRVRTVSVRPDGTIVDTSLDGTSQTLSPNDIANSATSAAGSQVQSIADAGTDAANGLTQTALAGQTPNVGGPVGVAGQVVDQTVDLEELNSANGLPATGLTASGAVPRSRPASGPSARQIALARQLRDIPVQDGPARATTPAPVDLLTSGAGAPTSQNSQQVSRGAGGQQVTTTRVVEPPSVLNGYVVQVSSQRTEELAREAAATFTTKYAELISDYQPIISRTNLGDQGTFYRVRIGVMPDQAEAIEFCRSLKAAGADCFVTR